jgi:hypothetical protein
MLGGGPTSQYPRLQSQQIRGTLPRTVTRLSLRYPQLLWLGRRDLRGARRRESFVRAAASGLTMTQHRASCSDPEH